MGDPDVDDIFKDFETKVDDKPTSAREEHSEEKHSDEELLKRKYQKAEHELKEKHREEKEALTEKRNKGSHGHENIPSKKLPNLERIAYIAIILVLVVYTFIDMSYYSGTGVEETDQPITAVAVTVENKTDKIEEVAEVVEEEEEELSGVITISIDNIYTDVPDEDEDMGYLSKIVFTIDNGKDKILTPFVEVFAYDDENKDPYETRSRGQYTYKMGISPGKSHTGSIDLVPKSWSNLDLKKHIRLVMNDTEDGYITSWNDEVFIK